MTQPMCCRNQNLVSTADEDKVNGIVEAKVWKELSSCLGNEAFRFK